MGHEPRGFIAMKQNGVTMKQNGIFRNGMMKNAIFHHGMMKNVIFHHGMVKNAIFHHGMVKNGIFHNGVMKNGICLMVSDAKLCNNVANYGTKSIIFSTAFVSTEKLMFGPFWIILS